jgi:HD-like signal output (HDOD) protein
MTVVPDEKALAAMLQGIDIPPCPAVLVDVDAELRKDAPDPREISRLISKDVALSGHVMQIANSPAFSAGRQLDSLTQALHVLGTRQVFNLVVVQLLKTAMSGNAEVSMERFWESSAQIARLSSEVARRLRCVRPDVAYTFGLFRDCGIPLMMKRFPETRRVLAEANRAEEACFTDIEDQQLGSNHAVVGYFLAKRWRLPVDVVQAIQIHHDYSALAPASPVSAPVKSLIACGVLAEHIIRLHTQGDGEQEWAKAASNACTHFGLSLGAIDDLIEDLRDWLG